MKTLYTILLLLVATQSQSQNYSWEWARSLGSTEGMNGATICADADGNVYASASYFGAEITIGSTTLQNFNEAAEDVFLVKYSTDGDVIWAKSFGGSGTDRFLAMECDSDGNILLTGSTNSTSMPFDGFTITPVGGYDSFIAKLDAEGNVIWVKTFGGSSNDFFGRLALDENNSIYIAGYYYSPTLVLDAFTLTNSGSPDTFVAKMNPEGDTMWALGVTGQSTTSEIPTALAASPNGQCLLTGTFSAPISIGSFNLNHVGGSDAFLALLASDGTVEWVEAIQTASFENITDVQFVNENSFYCVGWFEAASITLGNDNLLNAGTSGSDVFLASYQTDGSVNWAIRAGGDDNDNTGFIRVFNNDCFLSLGFESSTMDIGDYSFTNAGNEDICFAKINNSGEVVWAGAIGNEGYEFSSNFALDIAGNIYAGGTYSSDFIYFGENELTNASEFGSLMFVTKLVEAPLGIPYYQEPLDIIVYPNPCDDVVNLVWNDQKTEIQLCEIISLDGKVIRSYDLTKYHAAFRVNTSQLEAGFYFIKVIGDGYLYSKPLIVRKR